MNDEINRYFSLGIIFVLGVIILYMLRDFLTTILAAIILSYLVYPIFKYLNTKIESKSMCVGIVILALMLLVLVPLSAVAGVLVSQINNFDTDEATLIKYEQRIFEITGREVSVADTIGSIDDWLRDQLGGTLPKILSITTTFLVSTFIVFFIMFYLLVEKDNALKMIKSYLPFSKKNSSRLLDEGGSVIRAVFIGQVLTAIIQGTLGMISFFIAGIEGAIVWGFIMIILSIIPVIGAFLVWIPAGVFLLLEGNIGMGIFVLLWGGLIVSQVDNLIRPKLVNKFANIHPLETFLGIFMGIATLGIIGIIVGPLIISLFRVIVDTYRLEYVKGAS